MTFVEWSLFVSGMGAALLMVALAFMTGAAVRNARIRTRELEMANIALSAHYTQLETVLDSPDVSNPMKASVYTFHHVVVDRDEALRAAEWLFSNQRAAPNPEFELDYERLREANPKVFSALHGVIQSGISSMMLRWPEAASKYRQEPVARAIKARQQVDVAEQVINVGRNMRLNDRGDHHRHDNYDGAVPA